MFSPAVANATFRGPVYTPFRKRRSRHRRAKKRAYAFSIRRRGCATVYRGRGHVIIIFVLTVKLLHDYCGRASAKVTAVPWKGPKRFGPPRETDLRTLSLYNGRVLSGFHAVIVSVSKHFPPLFVSGETRYFYISYILLAYVFIYIRDGVSAVGKH